MAVYLYYLRILLKKYYHALIGVFLKCTFVSAAMIVLIFIDTMTTTLLAWSGMEYTATTCSKIGSTLYEVHYELNEFFRMNISWAFFIMMFRLKRIEIILNPKNDDVNIITFQVKK